ncbi:hypothetical protein EG835_14055 [bacterium]|nr:hypothetical protein [bacterium]
MLVVALSAALLPLSACTAEPEPQSSVTSLHIDERVQVYAQVIRQLYEGDGGFPGPTLYIVGWTDDSYGGGRSGPSVSGSTRITEAVRDGVTASLEDLPFTIVWVESFADVARDPSTGAVVGGGSVASLGRTDATQPVLEVVGGVYYGNLGAHGAIYKFKKVDGVWERFDDGTYTGWAS